jgi:ribose transport system permease protein
MEQLKPKKNVIKSIGRVITSYSYILIFLALFIVYYLSSKSLTWTGITNILRHSAVIGVMSFGMGLVIVTGEIDLSVGSMLAFVSSVSIVLFNITDSLLVLALMALAVGTLCGLLNGLLVGKAKMPSFIATLATMLILRSVVQFYSHILDKFYTGGGNNLYKMASTDAKNAFFKFGNSTTIGLPMVGLILIGITAIIVYMTTSTKFGKKVYAVGSNERAARLAGVNTDLVKVGVFTLSGLMVGIGAFMWVAMQSSVDPATTGKSNEMYAIAAVVLGGISMSGGRGKFLGVLFGAMSYTIIDKIIASINVDSLINDAIKGAILIVAILARTSFPTRRVKHRGAKQESGVQQSGSQVQNHQQ